MPSHNEVKTTFDELAPHLLTFAEAARILGIEKTTLNTYASSRPERLPVLRLKGRRYYHVEDVQAYLASIKGRRLS